ncbi:MAG: hypothetical protein VX834_10100 [Myxococcota bacterium]|nr:hypothetical protein [Myxococcota bacterium]
MRQTASTSAIRIFRALDLIRRDCMHLLVKAGGGPLLSGRELRVGLAGALGVLFIASLAFVLPIWLLALGPIVWGVPHVMADIRYMVIQPGLHRGRWLAAGAAVGVIWAGAGGGLWATGWTIMVLATCLGTDLWRSLVMGMAGLALAGLGHFYPWVSVVVFLHLHNFVAFGIWWHWRRRMTRWHWMTGGLVLTAMTLIVGGAWDGWSAMEIGVALWPQGFSPEACRQMLAPGLSPLWGDRVVMLFAFAQSLHYLVWLRLVPEDARRQPTPPSFVSSYRRLVRDFSGLILAGFALAVVGLILWASLDLSAARSQYLHLAAFHGYMELVALTWLFLERRPLCQHG